MLKKISADNIFRCIYFIAGKALAIYDNQQMVNKYEGSAAFTEIKKTKSLSNLIIQDLIWSK